MINSIISSIGNSRRYTLHSHTEFCDGRATMEAFARKAVEEGFTHYGFTPHSPVPIVSPCNMLKSNVERYTDEFNRICDTYGDRVHFYRSMEIDYLGSEWGPANDYFADLQLDYAIGSVHFIPSQDGVYIDIDGNFERFARYMHEYFHDDIRYVVEKFYEQSLAMVASGCFDIIGHLDKIGSNASQYSPGIETEDWYIALRTELINSVASSGIVAEINTKAWDKRQRMFPATDTWEYLLSRGIKLVVNSDVHVPALINAGRDEAFALLDQLTPLTIGHKPTKF